MARKLEFNKDAKLHKAMKLFWDRGYEATSMNNLVSELGINRFSIYNTFGDKKALFLEALALYRKTVLAYLLVPLKQQNDPGKVRVDNYLQRLGEELSKPSGSLGCMIMRSSLSHVASEKDVEQMLIAMLQDIRSDLLQSILDAKQLGEIARQENENELADYILCHLQGVILIRKATGDISIVQSQLNMLRKELASW